VAAPDLHASDVVSPRLLCGARYSPLTQIDRTHAKDLRVVWRWKLPDHASKDANPRIGPTFANESTPLMVGGTLFYKHITVASKLPPARPSGCSILRVM
jgi:glucose dehydrogenase